MLMHHSDKDFSIQNTSPKFIFNYVNPFKISLAENRKQAKLKFLHVLHTRCKKKMSTKSTLERALSPQLKKIRNFLFSRPYLISFPIRKDNIKSIKSTYPIPLLQSVGWLMCSHDRSLSHMSCRSILFIKCNDLSWRTNLSIAH